MARRNWAMSSRRADGRRQKAHLATAIAIRRYMRPRYAVLAAVVVCAFRYDGAGPAAAQSWPARPLTMVVPFAPGGGTDVLGRIVGRRLSEVLGQPVIIENVGGAGGEGGPGRLPIRARQQGRCDQPDALQKSALQFRCRSRAGGADRGSAHALGCAQGPPRG